MTTNIQKIRLTRLATTNPPVDWLPPRHEWDFRSVRAEDCRLACLWEYARSVEAIVSNPRRWVLGEGEKGGKGANTVLGNYLICEGGTLTPWVLIHDLSHNLFSTSDLINLPSFASKLKRHADTVSAFLWNHLSRATRRSINTNTLNQDLALALVTDLNKIIQRPCINIRSRFAGIELQLTTAHLLSLTIKDDNDVTRLNRMLLEDAYPLEIAKGRAWQPQFWKRFDVRRGSAIHVEPMVNVKNQIKQDVAHGKDVASVLDKHLHDLDYALHASFYYHGTQKILSALEAWVREEGKKLSDRPRGKGAQPPYDCLKWLAAYRLEKARNSMKSMKASFEEVQTMLKEEDRGRTDCPATLPIYASHGAWSKATKDAARLLNLLKTNPRRFELRMLF